MARTKWSHAYIATKVERDSKHSVVLAQNTAYIAS